MTFPTLTEIEDANWDYLTINAMAWTNLANTWESAFTEIRDNSACPGGTPWAGAGAEAQVANKGLVLSAVDTAEREDFRVGDDYSVTDTYTYYSSAAEQAQREQAAQVHASFIKSRAAKLVNNLHQDRRQDLLVDDPRGRPRRCARDKRLRTARDRFTSGLL